MTTTAVWVAVGTSFYVVMGITVYVMTRMFGERSHRMAAETAIAWPVTVPILIMLAAASSIWATIELRREDRAERDEHSTSRGRRR